jgi:hypothetical protein
LSYTAFLEGATVVTQSQVLAYAVSDTAQLVAPETSLNVAILSFHKKSYVFVVCHSTIVIPF